MIFDSTKIKKIIWFVPLELNHSSYIYTSLLEFANKNKIQFVVSSVDLNERGRFLYKEGKLIEDKMLYGKVCFAEFVFKSEKSKLIAFDLSDSPYDFPKEALEIADLVFKRTFFKEYAVFLPQKFQDKLRPMGLPFMVKPNIFSHKRKIKFYFFWFNIKNNIKFDAYFFKRIINKYKWSYNHWNTFFKTRKLSDFNKSVIFTNDKKIFYQKRFFPKETSNDVKEIHQQRINLIRLLKNNFPENFVGGLKLDPPLTDNFKDCLSNIDGNPHAFLEAFKSCGICVYTRGLTNSTGWTLPEFLSQGKCVIAEKTNVLFPNDLENNKHLIYFHSDDELFEICMNLIKDSNLVKRISQNAILYYNEFINPTKFIENIVIKEL